MGSVVWGIEKATSGSESIGKLVGCWGVTVGFQWASCYKWNCQYHPYWCCCYSQSKSPKRSYGMEEVGREDHWSDRTCWGSYKWNAVVVAAALEDEPKEMCPWKTAFVA